MVINFRAEVAHHFSLLLILGLLLANAAVELGEGLLLGGLGAEGAGSLVT